MKAPAPEPGSDAVMRCRGCGTEPDDPRALRCPHADRGDDVDHVLAPRLTLPAHFPTGGEPQPHLRYAALGYAYQAARARGLSHDRFTTLVNDLDAAVADVAGKGFRATPLRRAHRLELELGLEGGALWVKNETRNVAGSHKARHLMGVMIHLEALRRTGHGDPGGRLAIASCGNAALAAAVLARATGRELDVFVPPTASARVVEQLQQLGANLVTCARRQGVTGDPCYRRFRQAIAGGAVPFGCQGPDNGMTIEGGATLGYEIAATLQRAGEEIDALVVQVGGGALASACQRAMENAHATGAIGRLPRLHAVQTESAAPLARAYERLAAHIAARLDDTADIDIAARARRLAAPSAEAAVEDGLRHAARHRSEFMWSWESVPKSIASGILDDETYDWHAVVAGMLRTGGWPITVDEPTLRQAHALARSTARIEVSPTGSAGLAGLLSLRASGALAPHSRMAVIFSGAQR